MYLNDTIHKLLHMGIYDEKQSVGIRQESRKGFIVRQDRIKRRTQWEQHRLELLTTGFTRMYV